MLQFGDLHDCPHFVYHRAEKCKGAHVGPQVEVGLGSKGHGEHQWGQTLLETFSAGRRSGGKGKVTVREEEKVTDEGRCEKSSAWGYYARDRGQVHECPTGILGTFAKRGRSSSSWRPRKHEEKTGRGQGC